MSAWTPKSSKYLEMGSSPGAKKVSKEWKTDSKQTLWRLYYLFWTLFWLFPPGARRPWERISRLSSNFFTFRLNCPSERSKRSQDLGKGKSEAPYWKSQEGLSQWRLWGTRGGPEGPARHLNAARQELPRDNFCHSVAAQLPSLQGQFWQRKKCPFLWVRGNFWGIEY